MSNYLNREKYDYITNRFGGNPLAFRDSNTNPKNLTGLMRRILSKNGDGLSKHRAYNMFVALNRHVSSKPDQSTLTHQYNDITNALFRDFVNMYGKFNPPKNLVKTLGEVRMKLMMSVKTLTKCGNVNIIFKKASASIVFEEKISMFINNGEAIKTGIPIPFKVESTGIVFDKDTTLTIIIPIKYIETCVDQSYRASLQNLIASGIKVESGDPKVVSAVMARLSRIVGCDLFNASFAAIYKDEIYSSFAKDVVNIAQNLIKYKMDGSKLGDNLCTSSSTSVTNTLDAFFINMIIREEGINELSPSILMDIFDIRDEEVNTFVKNFVRSDDYRITNSPKSALLLNDSDVYVDTESRVSASCAYISRFNYCIIALMLFTKNSIKESTRMMYCNSVRCGIENVSSYSRTSNVTNNKNGMLSEIDDQIDLIESLASDIIKLKRYAAGER